MSDYHMMSATEFDDEPYPAQMTDGPFPSPSAPAAIQEHEKKFTRVIGKIPWMSPNVRPGKHTAGDLEKYLNQGSSTNGALRMALQSACCMTGIGALYMLKKQVLIKDGQYGFSMNNGRSEVLLPGRHMLLSPFNTLTEIKNSGDDVISVGPISIIRVHKGYYGFALNEGRQEVLLPGLHVRKSPTFKFHSTFSQASDMVSAVAGPMKMFTVQSGTARVCYDKGTVQIFGEGRYFVNSGTFQVGDVMNCQQQNVRYASMRHL